jgi:DNA-binding NtrC family response regulator
MIVYILREDGSPRSLAEIERDIIVKALNHYGYQSQAAAALIIARSTIRGKIETYKIKKNGTKQSPGGYY